MVIETFAPTQDLFPIDSVMNLVVKVRPIDQMPELTETVLQKVHHTHCDLCGQYYTTTDETVALCSTCIKDTKGER